jgi:hypothetical protein
VLFQLYLLGKISKKKFLGTARVLTYGLVVTAGFGALSVRSAVADVGDQSLEVGRKLGDLQDLLHGASEFRLNGQTVFFSSSNTDESLKTVLDRFEAHCNKSRAFEALEWKSLANVKGKDIGPSLDSGVNHFGVLRKEDTNRGDGVVMCFTRDNGPKDILVALKAFESTGDLHDLGDVRYVHAARKNGVTAVQTMWTEGTFNIRSIVGTPGHDAVGSDFATLPRPEHSTRLITAEAVGAPYAARIYESTDAPDVALNTYQAKMYADGWSSATSPDVGLDKNGFDGRYFVKPNSPDQAVISVSKNKDSQKTMIVVGSTGATPKTGDLRSVTP